MIVLDTNYLIRILVARSEEFDRVAAWFREGEVLATSSVAWFEFCCGPVTENEQGLVLSLLKGGVLSLGEDQAAEGARIYNATGRLRSLRIDSLVAATAILAKASLATSNRRDFEKFLPLGLRLAWVANQTVLALH